jgi:glutamine amidotransferase
MCFEKSEEGNLPGLGIFPGEIKKFPVDICKKVPQIGWNRIEYKESPLFCDLPDDHFYFVHSYYTEPKLESDIVCTTNYCGIEFTSMVGRGRVAATQFHIEKSGKYGLQILKNFANL